MNLKKIKRRAIICSSFVVAWYGFYSFVSWVAYTPPVVVVKNVDPTKPVDARPVYRDEGNCMPKDKSATVVGADSASIDLSDFQGYKEGDYTTESTVSLTLDTGQTIVCSVGYKDLSKILKPGMKINLSGGTRVL